MYDVKSMKAEEFISDEEIRETLAYADENCENLELVDALLKKAEARKGLNHREASVLLACQDPERIQRMYRLAEQIKKDFYGNRIVMFAPMRILSVSCGQPADRPQKAQPGRDPQRGYRAAGYGT